MRQASVADLQEALCICRCILADTKHEEQNRPSILHDRLQLHIRTDRCADTLYQVCKLNVKFRKPGSIDCFALARNCSQVSIGIINALWVVHTSFLDQVNNVLLIGLDRRRQVAVRA